MKYTTLHETRFRNAVTRSMERVREILVNEETSGGGGGGGVLLLEDDVLSGGRDPNHHHKYDDKYSLVEFLTNTCIASQMNLLERCLNFDASKLNMIMSKWMSSSSSTSIGINSSSSSNDNKNDNNKNDTNKTDDDEETEKQTTTTTTEQSSSSSSSPRHGGRGTPHPPTIILRFSAEDSCILVREQEVDLVSSSSSSLINNHHGVVETTTATTTTTISPNNNNKKKITGSNNNNNNDKDTETTTTTTTTTSSTTKVVNKLKEYYWKVEVTYKIVMLLRRRCRHDYQHSSQQQEEEQQQQNTEDNDHDNVIELQSRTSSTIIVTRGGGGGGPMVGGNRGDKDKPPVSPPIPQRTIHPDIDLNITWFFDQIEPKQFICQFRIHRFFNTTTTTNNNNINHHGRTSSCRTPRRNDDVNDAIQFNKNLYDWMNSIMEYFTRRIDREILAKHNPYQQPKPTTTGKTAKTTTAAATTTTPATAKKTTAMTTTKSGLPIWSNGSIAVLTGLQKEPTFNGHKVRITDYLHDKDRYQVEPVDKSGTLLPHVLLIKPQSLLLDVSDDNDDDDDDDNEPASTSTADADDIMEAAIQTIRTPMLLTTLTEKLRHSIFIPIVPLLNNDGNVLSLNDVATFLSEQNRTFDHVIVNHIHKLYPISTSAANNSNKDGIDEQHQEDPPHHHHPKFKELITVIEGTIVLMCMHMQKLTLQYIDSIDYIEYVLQQQLITAIGKEISASDFMLFIRHYNQHRLFTTPYKPKPFSYVIRRPYHYPDGIITIEPKSNNTNNNNNITNTSSSESGFPIETFVRHIPSSSSAAANSSSSSNSSIYCPINASTSIELLGDRYIHGWIQNTFQTDHHYNNSHSSSDSSVVSDYNMILRTKQFSCYLVLIGTMIDGTHFEPKHGIILQNKDEILIPLLTTILPTQHEFLDSISSLSPEQRQFAIAYRRMQLESSLFSIAIIQLKPQLETLLGLPTGSLTKEIQLTQDLMSLFVDYQIPSDMLSLQQHTAHQAESAVASTAAAAAAGTSSSTSSTSLLSAEQEKINCVKGYVHNVMDMIEKAKQKQMDDAIRKNDMQQELLLQQQQQKQRNELESADYDDDYQRQPKVFAALSSSSSITSNRVSASSHLEQDMVRELSSETTLMSRSVRRNKKVHASARSLTRQQPQPQQSPAIPITTASTSTAAAPVAVAATTVYNNNNNNTNAGYDDDDYYDNNDNNDDNGVGDEYGGDENQQHGGAEDFTLLPKILDAKLDDYVLQQEDSYGCHSSSSFSSLRSTIIKASNICWTRNRQENLFLTDMKSTKLDTSLIHMETKKAYDLLDAITRSGTLPILDSEIHIIVGVSHCFYNDIMGTIIQDNINPIEKLEYSSILMASIIHGMVSNNNTNNTNRKISSLIKNKADLERLSGSFPSLFETTTTTNKAIQDGRR